MEGSLTHRLLLPDRSWRSLDEIQLGDRVVIGGGAGLWAEEPVHLSWQPKRRPTLASVAERSGVDIETVIRYRRGVRGRHAERMAAAVAEYDAGLATMTWMQNKRRAIRVPAMVDEQLAAFLGYLVGDGHISQIKRVIGLTTGDEEQADTFSRLAAELFGMTPRRKWDDGRWRVSLHSEDLQDFLIHLGLTTGFSARVKDVPEVILRSPKQVVAAFLRAYFDCDGYAGKQGVILSTASETMSRTVQLLLLNFGILSHRRAQKDGCWHVHTMGRSGVVFEREIGFGLRRKQDALRTYIAAHHWFKREDWDDEIVALERRRADVYDISVEETHRYAAQGFINHNSFWHSTILTEQALTPSEIIDFADHHSGTMATSPGRLNPYKLGIELFRDIEERWNKGRFGKEYEECDDLDRRRTWDLQLGKGRAKIFEVRHVHNDVTFIDTFLTPEFCRKHKLFSFKYDDTKESYEIESREFQTIKTRLLFSLTNFGQPLISVVDANAHNRGELRLQHHYSGVPLRLDHAQDTLRKLQQIWKRPVHIETVIDGKNTLLSYDGSQHTSRQLGRVS